MEISIKDNITKFIFYISDVLEKFTLLKIKSNFKIKSNLI